MEVLGYKCFHEDLINHYGQKFQVGKIYIAPGTVQYGLNGNGFHMCKNMEDTLRYFDTRMEPITICHVLGYGNIQEVADEYYGYYDLYAVERIKILKELSREEVISLALDLPSFRVQRFLSLYSLEPKEIERFKLQYQKDQNVLDTIAYYQENHKDVYEKRYKKWIKS